MRIWDPAKRRERYLAKKDSEKRRQAEYYRENREEILAKQRAKYQVDLNKSRAYKRESTARSRARKAAVQAGVESSQSTSTVSDGLSQT